MLKCFLEKVIDNKNIFYLVLFVSLALGTICFYFTSSFGIIFVYIFLTLFYIERIRKSIQWATTVVKQVIWLILAPIIIALLPFVVIELIIPRLVYNDYFFAPMYLLFFVLTGIIAAFIFELKTIKISMQIVNGIFLSIVSLTFIFYFQSENLYTTIEPNLAAQIKLSNISIDTLFDLLIKVITIPYILLGIWGNIAVLYRENRS